uniref:Uncharacterized protein n=1 Tax=Rhipicephalus zambeziensis TaxID=60191 RepID=A0A224YKY7_9ACAR
MPKETNFSRAPTSFAAQRRCWRYRANLNDDDDNHPREHNATFRSAAVNPNCVLSARRARHEAQTTLQGVIAPPHPPNLNSKHTPVKKENSYTSSTKENNTCPNVRAPQHSRWSTPLHWLDDLTSVPDPQRQRGRRREKASLAPTRLLVASSTHEAAGLQAAAQVPGMSISRDVSTALLASGEDDVQRTASRFGPGLQSTCSKPCSPQDADHVALVPTQRRF